MADPATPARVRLDVWLDVACLFRTRSEAQRACKGGKIEVNGHRAKPNRDVHPGDSIALTRGAGVRQVVVVRALADVHLPKARARLLYEDATPPPSDDELALRDLLRLTRPRTAPGAPTPREKRARRRLKEGWDGQER
jgi:ribosome-associated heat shock protein Hsp15